MIKTTKKRIDYRHVICVAVTIGFLACSVFIFSGALGRLIESCRDFGLSIAYYFSELFGIAGAVTPTVNDLPKVPFFPSSGTSAPSTSLPDTWTGFQNSWGEYWQLWATLDNFKGYLVLLGNITFVVCQVLVVVIPLIALLLVSLRRYMNTRNNDYDKDSRPLKAYKAIAQRVFSPIKSWVLGLVAFVREHRAYRIAWLIIWLYNFNVFTIALEFFAFYFYFAMSFDVINIYRQVYKLALDLWAVTSFFPWWVFVVVALIVIDKLRKKIGYLRLNHYERKNRGFINARPIVYMVCGTMGKKKTTAITDMVLSQEVMFRDKAFEKILENDLKFPYFPWCNLENVIKRAMAHHEIYNLATVRLLIEKKLERWTKKPCREKLFDYDYARYGFVYNDNIKLVSIWETIETYAQLYYIYIIQSSLLISNYSVRTDALISDIGNFPRWNSDFFRRDSRLLDSFSRHAHILDFDALRLGKKVLDNNPNANSFDFGIVAITEIGKERGNSLENQEKKRKDETANQKNDLFNSWLKMVRHSATVDNFPFVRVIADEQRPESWGADARDLCEIVHIRESGDTRLTMPLFTLEELLYNWLFAKFADIYYRYRYVRADNTLLLYLLKTVTAKMHNYYKRIHNTYDYCPLRVQIESGTQDGQLEANKYYLMSKKIYSKRFSTDCFSDYFSEKSLRSPFGINDLNEYQTERATIRELDKQHSYFISDLSRGLKVEDEKRAEDER